MALPTGNVDVQYSFGNKHYSTTVLAAPAPDVTRGTEDGPLLASRFPGSFE
jgi:hypothetical protein